MGEVVLVHEAGEGAGVRWVKYEDLVVHRLDNRTDASLAEGGATALGDRRLDWGPAETAIAKEGQGLVGGCQLSSLFLAEGTDSDWCAG